MALLRLITSSYMSLLLITVPLGWAAYFANWGPIAVFVLVRHALLSSFHPWFLVRQRNIDADVVPEKWQSSE